MLCTAAVVAMSYGGWPDSGIVRWLLYVSLSGLAALQLYEAVTAWCVLRACGWRTPL